MEDHPIDEYGDDDDQNAWDATEEGTPYKPPGNDHDGERATFAKVVFLATGFFDVEVYCKSLQ